MSTLIYHDLSMSNCYILNFHISEAKGNSVQCEWWWSLTWVLRKWVVLIGQTCYTERRFKWQDSSHMWATNLWKWDSLSHPQPFVTMCSHHSNLTEMNLTQNILYIFKHFMYRTKNIRIQNHCYVHKFADYTHYEECNKVWWQCLVSTSTTRFASDVGYRMAKM